MRGLRSTIALVVVLAGLGAYVYFVTWKLPEGGADASAKKEKVFAGLEAAKIDELKISSAAGDSTTLKKDAGGWQMTAPLAAKADESEIASITSALTSADLVRVVDENPGDLNAYGLLTPRIEIDFKAAGDKDYRKLLVGEKTPTGADLFARRNDEKKVFLIPAMHETTLNRTTFDLRDKSLLKVDREKLDGVEVTAGGKTLLIAKDAGEWKLKKPIETKADFGAAENLVSRLQSLQMKSIAADEATPADLKKFGLDKPEATVNLSSGSSRATLVVGGKAADGTVYARDMSKPSVVTIETATLDEFKKSADDYRRKDLFEFRPYNATHIELSREGKTIVLDRQKGQGDNAPDKWHRAAPAGDIDKEKMDGLLSKLSNMRAASFVESTAKTGTDKPALTVTIKYEDGKKEEKVTFGQSGSDVFALRTGEPGAAKADTADFNDVIKTFDEISK
jgi:Domain of unknown function (DUF4340)